MSNSNVKPFPHNRIWCNTLYAPYMYYACIVRLSFILLIRFELQCSKYVLYLVYTTIRFRAEFSGCIEDIQRVTQDMCQSNEKHCQMNDLTLHHLRPLDM